MTNKRGLLVVNRDASRSLFQVQASAPASRLEPGERQAFLQELVLWLRPGGKRASQQAPV